MYSPRWVGGKAILRATYCSQTVPKFEKSFSKLPAWLFNFFLNDESHGWVFGWIDWWKGLKRAWWKTQFLKVNGRRRTLMARKELNVGEGGQILKSKSFIILKCCRCTFQKSAGVDVDEICKTALFKAVFFIMPIEERSFWNCSHAIPLQRGLVFTKIIIP